ncbi:MAG: DNA recombination protein RmuC, partial [Dehalococcoidia bacterium]
RMKTVGEDLQAVRASATQILEVGKSISGLEDILKPPKMRGELGEMLLERLLAQILPAAHYTFQRRFQSGEIVDAVIDLGVAQVPVDAKFPLESFTRMIAADTDEERARLRREFVRAVIALAVAALALVVHESREGRRRLEARLDRMDGRLDVNLQATADRMKTVGEDLQAVRASATQILEVGKSISGLEDILKPPKMRGELGEMLLERLLAQILPAAHYTFQRRFQSGEVVDAVIDLGVAQVPVDAKFPLESFTRMIAADTDEERARLRREFVRAVRGHVDAVAKYIRPDEGTFDFALMYIPAENVYYETIVKTELELAGGSIQEYALERRVIPVSPNSFYAYLQVIVLGLRGMHVERRADEILGRLGRLKNDYVRFQQEYGVLGRHLTNAKNKYDEVDKAMERFGDRLELPLAEAAEQVALPEEAARAEEAPPVGEVGRQRGPALWDNGDD